MNEEIAMRTLAYLITHYKEHDETIINLEEIQAIEFLQQENHQLKETYKDAKMVLGQNHRLKEEINKLKDRIEKAIEYIENNKDQAPNGEDVLIKICLLGSDIDELLKILKGEE